MTACELCNGDGVHFPVGNMALLCPCIAEERERLRAENSSLTSALALTVETLELIVNQRENFPEAAAEKSIRWAGETLDTLKTLRWDSPSPANAKPTPTPNAPDPKGGT